jgi:hypothetical protein
MSLVLSASSIRTPNIAPVDPVMPMIRRRIGILRHGRDLGHVSQQGHENRLLASTSLALALS